MKLYDQIVDMIRGARGKLWTSQGDLAKRAGVSQSQISKLLNKEGTIGFSAACDLLESLGARFTLGSDVDSLDKKGELLSRVVSANEKLVAENVKLLKENADLRVELAETRSSALSASLSTRDGKTKKVV